MHRLLSTVVLGVALTGVCLAQTPSGQTPATPAPPARSAIIGTVLEEGTGKPIAGALVQMSPASGTVLPKRDNSRVLTGSDGRFMFTELTQGYYSLNASRGGYLATGPGGTTFPNTMLVDLAENQVRSDVKIEMAKPGTITGTILDEAGEPVIGAQVQVARRTRARGRMIWQQTGGSSEATDDRGMYRVGNLAPGDYVVLVDQTNVNLPTAMIEAYQKASETSRPGQSNPYLEELAAVGGMGLTPGTSGARMQKSQVQALPRSTAMPTAGGVYPVTYYPAAYSPSKATALTIRSGEERSAVDFVLRPSRAISISGTVNAPDGPAALTAVVLTSPEGIESFNSSRIATTTDVTGAFTFLNVPTGDYVLRVTKIPAVNSLSNMVSNSITMADGSTSFMSSSSGPARLPPLPPDPTFWAEMPVSAGARDITGLAVTLQSGAKLSGRVQFDGALAKPTPQQISAFSFSMQPLAAGLRASRAPRTRIDEQGELTSQGFPPGEYAVNVFGGAQGWSLQSVTSKGVDVTQQPLEIGNSDINDIVITFSDKATEITGAVTGQNGSIPKTAAVVIFPSDEQLAHDYGVNMRRVVATRASTNGRYTFRSLPPGDYRVIAIDDVSIMSDLTAERLQPLIGRATSVRFAVGEKRQQNLTLVTVK